MPETAGYPRSPEALHTWLDALITQVDHAAKEAEALMDALNQLPENARTHMRSQVNDHIYKAVYRLFAVHADLVVTQSVLDHEH